MLRILNQSRMCSQGLISIFVRVRGTSRSFTNSVLLLSSNSRTSLPNTYNSGQSLSFSSTTARAETEYKPETSSESPKTITLACWKCQNTLTSLSFPVVCPTCHTLQKHNSEMIPDYFTMLGQSPKSYRVDGDVLSLTMKKMQRQLHPDLFSNKSQEEQEVSQSLSSIVNQAIVTLQNPIQRGLYLLELRGIVIDLEKQLTLDTEFLGEVMELNEKLDEISNSQEWLDFRSANEKELEILEKKLAKAFERDNTKEAQLVLSHMKYFENLQLKLKEIQSKFNVVD